MARSMLNSVWFPFVKCLLSVVSAEVESWQLRILHIPCVLHGSQKIYVMRKIPSIQDKYRNRRNRRQVRWNGRASAS